MPNISIHTLRMEGDAVSGLSAADSSISIHTLRMEGDWVVNESMAKYLYFNPHPPHGG